MHSKQAQKHALFASINALVAVPMTLEYVLIALVLDTKIQQDFV